MTKRERLLPSYRTSGSRRAASTRMMELSAAFEATREQEEATWPPKYTRFSRKVRMATMVDRQTCLRSECFCFRCCFASCRSSLLRSKILSTGLSQTNHKIRNSSSTTVGNGQSESKKTTDWWATSWKSCWWECSATTPRSDWRYRKYWHTHGWRERRRS